MVEIPAEFMQKYQRDINRIFDSDRNTRKRGLQKLLEDLPWSDTTYLVDLQELCKSRLFPQVLLLTSDSVEKCRELSLNILKKILSLFDSYADFAEDIIASLCSRVSDISRFFNKKQITNNYHTLKLRYGHCAIIGKIVHKY